jgi:pilus assembly protein CpaB
MDSKPFIMVGLAIVFGGSAVLMAQRWTARQADVGRPAAAPVEEARPLPVGTIVVAARPLRYGMELAASSIREVPWPDGALPAGAYKTVAEVLAGNGKRVVLSAIEPNEPVLQPKITGPGQRSTLSALIDDGMGAVTIQVNEVVGVAGFVLPGDRVDVLLTRQIRGGGGEMGPANASAFTDVVLRQVRVLAVGQTADDRADKPSVVTAVTLEVDSIAAQKIALATSAGTLSLMLRKAGDLAAGPARRVSLAEIGHEPKASDQKVVRVTRAMERQEYSVPSAPTQVGTTTASDRTSRALPQVAAAP